MTPVLYDGRKRAEEIRLQVKDKIAAFKKETGVTPTLAIIKVNKSKATDIFTRLKQKAAEEVGASVEIYDKSRNWITYKDVTSLVRFLCSDSQYHGVMVQLPFPQKMKKKGEYIFEFITAEKDVDGLGQETKFIKPVVRAINDAVEVYKREMKKDKLKILVIGSKGIVGRSIVSYMKEQGNKVEGIDKKGNLGVKDKMIRESSAGMDLIITSTGRNNLVKKNSLSAEIGIIDVGAPNPEVNFDEVKDKLTFYTPVPGGIGPVTIAYLLENLYKAAYNSTQ